MFVFSRQSETTVSRTVHKLQCEPSQKGALHGLSLVPPSQHTPFYLLKLHLICDDFLYVLFCSVCYSMKPQPLSKLYRHSKNATLFGEFVNDPRLQLESTPGKHLLKISYVQSSDAGTYFCIGGSSFIFNFLEGIVIHVKSPGLNIPASVHQSASEIIQPGGSLTLNCTVHTGTCDGEHSVYWFKHSQESHPGVIYTHGGRNDQCERKDNTQTHTCVYNVSIKSLNLSHAGTYYCAVASCGHILFGNGTTLDFEANFHVLFFIVYLLFLITEVFPIRSFLIQNNQDSDNLHYAALREFRAKRSPRQRDDTQRECVYSGVRQ
uniref:Ig-like domain-containing protein n=1 Tax=Sparus aurata TaxID=8175 RepID=A0A671XVN8_SPAAU